MVLEPTYLASENSAIERRSRSLHRFLVGSPVALLVAVGLVAHFPKPPHRQPSGSAGYDRQVLAYVGRVAAAQKLRKAGGSDAEVYGQSRSWVAGYASGELVAVAPAGYEDHLREGVRGEILRAGLSLASEDAVRAGRSLFAGRAKQAAEGAVLAAETARGLRMFEVQAHLQCLVVVRRSLLVVEAAWPSVPAATKAALRPRIEALAFDPAEVEQLYDTERAQFEDYLRRQQITAENEADYGAPNWPNGKEAHAAGRIVQTSNSRIKALLGA